MSVTKTGACKFCGQINAFEWPDTSIPTDEELVEEGTRACDCESAREYRDREYRINAACECIDRILPNAEEKTANILLKNSVKYIATGEIHQISINIGNGTRVKMQMAGEAIKVVRNDSSSRQETV